MSAIPAGVSRGGVEPDNTARCLGGQRLRAEVGSQSIEVRTLAIAVAGSAVVHAAVAAWFGWWGAQRRAEGPVGGELEWEVEATAVVVDREDDLLEIEIEQETGDRRQETGDRRWVDPADALTYAPAVPFALAHPRAHATASVAAPAPAPASAAPLGLSVLRRAQDARPESKPPVVTLKLPERRPGVPALDRLGIPDEGPPPAPGPLEPPRPRTPPRIRSEMVPDGGGGRRVDQGVFVARVGRDGHVSFRDRRNLRARIALPSRRDIGEHLERWAKDPYGVAAEDERAVDTHTVTLLSGSFDLTDWAMRHAGMDPYQHRKLSLLDRTRDERAGMAASAEREDLRDSVAILPRQLAAIWKQPWPAAVRRRVLFERWDECAEHGTTQVMAGARQARATIVAFIRHHLPAGSGDAYPAAELQALNSRRSSRQRFDPYRDGEGFPAGVEPAGH